MAQTKRKRRSKHRGNAAGIVEARGRTGRKPTPEERKRSEKKTAREVRQERMNRPPTWRGALNRAAIATVVFFAAVVLAFKQPLPAALAISALMLVLYIPMGYYTDSFIYKRRMAKKAKGG